MSNSYLDRAFAEQLGLAQADFREDGWEVYAPVMPGTPWLPEPLRSFELDMVARRGDELVVVELRSRRSRYLSHLNRLALAVAKVPNARLEVYWLGDEPDTEPTRQRVLDYVDRTRRLLESELFDAAAISAWAGLEGALDLYVEDAGAPIPSGTEQQVTAWRKVTELYSMGFLSEADYELLAESFKRRNAAAHFRSSGEPPNAADIEAVLSLVERMAQGQYVSVDRMIEWYADEHDYPEVPLTEMQRRVIRRILEVHFPGTPDRDLDVTISRLEHDAAL